MGLDVDEWVYGRLVRYFKKSRLKAAHEIQHAVYLHAIRPRLTLLARAITGNAIDIYPAEAEGGYKHNSFFLPISFSVFPNWEENLSFFFFRTLYLCAQQDLGYNWNREEDDLILSRQMAEQTAPSVLEKLYEEFGNASQMHEKLRGHFKSQAKRGEKPDFSLLYGKWMYADPTLGEKDKLQDFDDRTKKGREENPTTTLTAKAVEEVKNLTIDKKQQEDYVLLHNFEKVETAEESNGVWRDFDGKDDLEDHQDALEELSMKFTVRVDDPVHSVYQAEFVENTTVSESAERDEKGFHLCYDEWDYKKRLYKPDFCKVYPQTLQKSDLGYYQDTICKNASTLTGLRKMLASVNNSMKQQRRMNQGEAFDLDALTDLFTDVHLRKTPSENIYLSKRKKENDLSILLLLDISLSSDGYAANNRVIDVEKEVSILFGEILDEYAIDFSIDSFYSKTRNYSTYLTLKEFGEDWKQGRLRIGAAEPQGYTRIGTALRHAGARLAQRPTKDKWVILISDGKPNDYDRYEGKYGIQDIKQALRELNEKQIHSYALAIEAQARYYLPQMFGQSHYQILTTPVELLRSLVKLFEKMKYG
ncbi:Nitric oxide reductase activation protein NorD [Lunatimonas lonarensis]|uniref:Nitric oxide reductase activation protein NorD n=1 Tax=Lunatimonas lonarensis TaxID=1232681 RepID=R7ZPC5_9BACT|nr:VWA domain-containing protein [Lunatimonas lonarensis]EON75937.1 Nitric oxide reductase activation protein NorD [Lunatimonas lonarensis]